MIAPKLLPGWTAHVGLFREKSMDYGTTGRVYVDNKFFCYSLELPWRDNAQSKSCIPASSYFCKMLTSPKFNRECYAVYDVQNRSNILIHSGNHAGDVDKGLKTNVEGCILFGFSFGMLHGQNSILGSRDAVSKFENELKSLPFILRIYQ